MNILPRVPGPIRLGPRVSVLEIHEATTENKEHLGKMPPLNREYQDEV